MSAELLLEDDEDLTAVDAGEVLLTYAIAIAEGKTNSVCNRDYRSAHQRLLRDPVARNAADRLLVRCRTPDLLWSHLRSVATGSGSWDLRRKAAHRLIDPVLDALHDRTQSPLDDLVTETAGGLDADSVTEAWATALARRTTDPEGAITMARTLLASTLKTILDDRDVPYKESDDLPGLYMAVSGELGLAPSHYSEQAFNRSSVQRGVAVSRASIGLGRGASKLNGEFRRTLRRFSPSSRAHSTTSARHRP